MLSPRYVLVVTFVSPDEMVFDSEKLVMTPNPTSNNGQKFEELK